MSRFNAKVLTVIRWGRDISKSPYEADLSCGHAKFYESEPRVGQRTYCDLNHVVLLDGTYRTGDDARYGDVDLAQIDYSHPDTQWSSREEAEKDVREALERERRSREEKEKEEAR